VKNGTFIYFRGLNYKSKTEVKMLKIHITLHSIIFFLIMGMILNTGCCKREPEQTRAYPMRKPQQPLVERRAHSMINRFSRDVNLTDEQEAAINKIKDEIFAKQKEAREEARKNRDKLKNEIITLVKSDKIDKEQIQKILRNEEVIREKGEMIDFLAEKLLQIHDLLTPEQREKIAKKIENFEVKNRNEKN